MNDNATPENMSKLARLIAISQPLNEQAVSEAIDLCADAWRADKAEMANMALARRANVILVQRLEAAERWMAGAIKLEPRLESLDLGAELTQDDIDWDHAALAGEEKDHE